MTEISPPVLFLVLSAIAAGMWKAFTYFHRHFKEAEALRRELWPEVRPFHAATENALTVAIRVLNSSILAKPQEFQTHCGRWQAMYDDKRGRLGRRGRRRASDFGGLLHDVDTVLTDPGRAQHYKINERDLSLKLIKVQMAMAEDADYFSR